jgi:aminoglycoside phosphotransferase
LPPDPWLVQSLHNIVCQGEDFSGVDLIQEPLPSSRPVYRFRCAGGNGAVVGKFYHAYPPTSSQDRGVAREFDNYLWAARLGLDHGGGLLPRLLGRNPPLRLGLLLEAVPGPDLDQLLAQACRQGDNETLYSALENLAGLLARFHRLSVPADASMAEALKYFDKLRRQLDSLGLLSPEDQAHLEMERQEWSLRFSRFPDFQVVLHGDATPTNFLFPHGRAVALDLERMRPGDRLFDLSWVAGEIKHAWVWRAGNWQGSEAAIGRFFSAYLAAIPGGTVLAERLYCLNPFYMALAELRIARNSYLSWDYRRELVAEARRCLAGGRR